MHPRPVRQQSILQPGTGTGPTADVVDGVAYLPTSPETAYWGRAAVALLGLRYGMSPPHAYAYLSAATDFDISQVVDVVKGVHARIRKADFLPDAAGPAAVSRT